MLHSKQENSTNLEDEDEEESIDLNPLKLLRRQEAALESGGKIRSLSKETCFRSFSDKNEDVLDLIKIIDAKDFVISNYRNEVRDGVEKLMHEVLKPPPKTSIEPEKKEIQVQTSKSFISDQILDAAIKKFEQEEADKHDSVDPEMSEGQCLEMEEGSQDSCDISQMFSPLLPTTKKTETLKVVWSSSLHKRQRICVVPAIEIPKAVVKDTQNMEPSSDKPELTVEGKVL